MSASLEASAVHWENLAQEQDERAVREEARGSSSNPQRARAKTYRRTALSIRLQISTGLPHCTVCLGPHPNHECPRRPGAKR